MCSLQGIVKDRTNADTLQLSVVYECLERSSALDSLLNWIRFLWAS
jgi:hypothetical protein